MMDVVLVMIINTGSGGSGKMLNSFYRYCGCH